MRQQIVQSGLFASRSIIQNCISFISIKVFGSNKVQRQHLLAHYKWDNFCFY